MNFVPAIIERLRAEVPELRQVGGAAAFTRAKDGAMQLPAAFVIPSSESAEPSPFMGEVTQQRVVADIAVMLAASSLADDEGVAANNAITVVREAVRAALLGWQPDPEADNLEFVRDDLVEFADSILWRGVTYRTAYLIRS